jgi:catechol 2,3-dioxygenase-like lactoylglutathione lyase family enzyme
MRVKHLGVVCNNEDDADRFYGGLLKLAKSERKEIPAALTGPLFGIDTGLTAFNYTGNGFQVEVFIHDAPAGPAGRIAHACLEVGDPDKLLERARAAGFTVTRLPKGTGWVNFLDDADGNRFEIK